MERVFTLHVNSPPGACLRATAWARSQHSIPVTIPCSANHERLTTRDTAELTRIVHFRSGRSWSTPNTSAETTMMPSDIRATYRVQEPAGFGSVQAAAVADYLANLLASATSTARFPCTRLVVACIAATRRSQTRRHSTPSSAPRSTGRSGIGSRTRVGSTGIAFSSNYGSGCPPSWMAGRIGCACTSMRWHASWSWTWAGDRGLQPGLAGAVRARRGGAVQRKSCSCAIQ